MCFPNAFTLTLKAAIMSPRGWPALLKSLSALPLFSSASVLSWSSPLSTLLHAPAGVEAA